MTPTPRIDTGQVPAWHRIEFDRSIARDPGQHGSSRFGPTEIRIDDRDKTCIDTPPVSVQSTPGRRKANVGTATTPAGSVSKMQATSVAHGSALPPQVG